MGGLLTLSSFSCRQIQRKVFDLHVGFHSMIELGFHLSFNKDACWIWSYFCNNKELSCWIQLSPKWPYIHDVQSWEKHVKRSPQGNKKQRDLNVQNPPLRLIPVVYHCHIFPGPVLSQQMHITSDASSQQVGELSGVRGCTQSAHTERKAITTALFKASHTGTAQTWG